jgi:hypothetical protein
MYGKSKAAGLTAGLFSRPELRGIINSAENRRSSPETNSVPARSMGELKAIVQFVSVKLFLRRQRGAPD